MVITDLMRPSQTAILFSAIAMLHAPGRIAASEARRLRPPP
jgi:hypothetical protein